ncbi:hypothetical protein [Nocardioides marmoribigeumensis]|uniref:SCP2 domain-containing protein n=1 Tax=Nocardioides marmoribigeumensis TaxID=433649 RepID=A0ABU2BV01_9ACTN|nr:hypothetical protein [Nocardioides marmoribigeumensis]MDR7362461.1 hypothetical protein [Nocardioides marmoribigeumensis]
MSEHDDLVRTLVRAGARSGLSWGERRRTTTVESPHREGSTGYEVEVGDRRVRLYGWADGQRGLPDVEDPWRDCTVRPAGAVNSLLERAGSDHRLGLARTGANDGLAVLGRATVLSAVPALLVP